MEVFLLWLALMVGHFLADYPLQGDFLAKAKNPVAEIPGVPWGEAMLAHTAIHGGMVWAITGLWWLGVLELAAHWVTDEIKCRGVISYATDQKLHCHAKILWAVLAVIFGDGSWVR